ncbi:MAG: M23 family metallopeptidase [Gammaproteobacteria bacterium]|nr:M23 family metallopeptidase [Gammaproteobacteria bacterium]
MHLLIINKNGIAAKGMHLRNFFLLLFFLLLLTAYATTEAIQWVLIQEQTNDISENTPSKAIDNSVKHAQIKKILIKDRQSLTQLEKTLTAQLDFVSLQLAKMQAKLIQIDSVRDQLVKKNELTNSPIPLSKIPGLGGPSEEDETLSEANKLSNKKLEKLTSRLVAIASEIQTQSEQLNIYEAIYDRQHIQETTFPSGRPSDTGWISSYFGPRKDPFTGKRAKHHGLDIAANEGDIIVATAKGVVTWAEKRYGYGKMIEITHGNNLVTRYGHCKSIAVKVGDIVEQGQIIGKIGNTGRSTGPHIHYEVLKNSVKLNPIKYVQRTPETKTH